MNHTRESRRMPRCFGSARIHALIQYQGNSTCRSPKYIAPARDDAKKKALIEKVTQAFVDALGVKPDSVWITVQDVEKTAGVSAARPSPSEDSRHGPAPMKLAISAASMRPTVIGRSQAVACGHYLAALASMRVLDAVAMQSMPRHRRDGACFTAAGHREFRGCGTTLIYLEKEDRVVSLAGLGYFPAATDINRLIAAGDGKSMPEGLLRTGDARGARNSH